ncbi:MAG: glycosyltransferase [Bacteroidales bacterium]
MMKKLLIITYYWPPSGGAGVQRWLKFVKYLRDFNWEPVVYTPLNPELPESDLTLFHDIPDGMEIIKTPIWEPYSAYKRFIGRGKEEKISSGFLSEQKKPGLTENISVWIRGNFFIPDARKFWIRPSVKHLLKYLENNPVDAVATTGPPHSCHLIGLGIKRKLNIPWIADFRDPWTQIDFYHELRLTSWADCKHKKLEKSVLKAADRVIMISRSQAEIFNSIFPRCYDVITNGYDHQDYLLNEEVSLDRKFSIAHIGSLVPARNPEILWKALSSICDEVPGFKDDLEIKLVGKVDYSVIESLKNNSLLSNLNKIDYLPHDEVVKLQFQSQVLLLLINNTPNANAILTGKFFEYLAVRRPILCIGPVKGDASTILQETGAGYTAGYDELIPMKKIIIDFYEKYKTGKLLIHSSGIEKYSRRNLTYQLTELLNTVAE